MKLKTGKRILEVSYPTGPRWAHPIRRAIEGNPVLSVRDKAWRTSELSDLAFAIETRLNYLPQIVTFIDDNIAALDAELNRLIVRHHLAQGFALTFRNAKALHRVLFGATAFVTESRSCFENLAAFYRGFLEVYCGRTISKPHSYNVVARSTRKRAWASALKRIRGDLIHARSLFLAYEVSESQEHWGPMFSMNWRPGHFARRDRIELLTLAEIWEGLYEAASAISRKIATAATLRRG